MKRIGKNDGDKDLRKHPGIDRAVAFVTSGLVSGTWQWGQQIPTVRKLAGMAHVSLGTMVKALALLKSEKKVSGMRQHRLRAGAPAPHKPTTEHLLSWQIKKNRLESEILSGSFGLSGAIPSIKELRVRYGVCFKTMRKMLRGLEQDGILAAAGKKYVLAERAGKRSRSRMVLITIPGHLNQVSALNSKYSHIANVIESECIKAGVRLDIVESDFYNAQESRTLAGRIGNDETTIGFILDVWWFESRTAQATCLEALDRLTRFEKPVAILDELGNFELPPQHARNSLLQVFRIEGKRAGERMARHLYGLGHRAVAYISITHYATWSQDRFAGAEEQFIRAGQPAGVHECTQTIAVHLPYILTASGFNDQAIRTLMTVGLSKAQGRDIEKQWEEFRTKVKKPYTGYPRLDAELRRDIASLLKLAERSSNAQFAEDILRGALETVGTAAFDILAKALFKKAVGTGATAWLCATDETAIRAMDFLQNRQRQVPRDTSVAGFDNVPVKALERRLTTFDFNALGFAHHLLNFILRPSKRRGDYRHQTIEVAGIVVERASTGRRSNRVDENQTGKGPAPSAQLGRQPTIPF